MTEIRAERKLGEILKASEKAKGRLLRGSRQEPREDAPTLADIGISEMNELRSEATR